MKLFKEGKEKLEPSLSVYSLCELSVGSRSLMPFILRVFLILASELGFADWEGFTDCDPLTVLLI